MSMNTCSLTAAAVAICVLNAPLLAQPAPTWNRKAEAIALTPAPGGDYEIHAAFSVQAADLADPVDLSTEILVFQNSSLVDILSFDLTGTPAVPGIACGDTTCSVLEGPCICLTGTFFCTCGWFVTLGTTSANLQPGDEIMVLLRPAPGAVPESNTGDDEAMTVFNDSPRAWDRRLASVELTPIGDSNIYDATVVMDVGASYEGMLSLGVEPQVFVNGVGLKPVDFISLPVLLSECADCGGGDCAFDPAGSPIGDCSTTSPFGGCWCGAQGIVEITIPDVPASPGDEIMVLLRPAPGALPELPGFEENDAMSIIAPGLCPADINGDGTVDVVDLLSLLAAWGPCGATCPEDINGDGAVNVVDLLELLAAWGPC